MAILISSGVSSVEEKLKVLGMASSYDVCAPPSTEKLKGKLPGIYYAWSSGGRVPLLKTLFTNGCSRDCSYCAFSALVDAPRHSFRVEELVSLFLQLFKKGLVQGLFLSSAIPCHPDDTMEKMVEVARRLKEGEGFKGYIHLKILPGTSPDLARKASRFASRVSINLEAPTENALKAIAPSKSLKGEILPIVTSLKVGFTTQFVVGVGGGRDLHFLKAVEALKKRYGLKRAYFQAFQPVAGTPLENHFPGSRERQLRLYQGEFLVRCYGFSAHELVDSQGDLPRHLDPKTHWALTNPQHFPVDLEKATYYQLLRVPGIGPRLARRLLALRARGELSLLHLEKAGINLRKSGPFFTIRGKRVVKGIPLQGRLELELE